MALDELVIDDECCLELPERLIIYHAGTGRTTFLAMVKITTLFIGAFFCFIVAPGYIKADKPELETAAGMFHSLISQPPSTYSPHLDISSHLILPSQTCNISNRKTVILCGIVPILFVAYTTTPFVTHIHIHLPPYARSSRAILERFVKTLPPSTPLTMTTMSAISKPRYSSLQAGDLVPSRRRFGLVNYIRDTTQENAKRKWYMFNAVGKFYVQPKGPQRKVRYEKKKDKVDGWIWDTIKERLDKKTAKTTKS